MKTITNAKHQKNLIDGIYEVVNLLSERGNDMVLIVRQQTKSGKRFFRTLLVSNFTHKTI